jgi:hypothetical protein
MTLKFRRILYFTFIIIFFLAAPPLVLYTAGFRYDFKYNRVVETGSLVVKSSPEKANIYLNNELQKETTPTIINTILPGEARLTIEKEGYHTWEKTIEIRPRVTTFEENVRLFADSIPEILIEDEIKEYWWNSKFEKIAYTNKKNELRIFNTLNSENTLIANLENSILEFYWSYLDDQFILSMERANKKIEHFIANASNLSSIVNTQDITNLKLSNISWDPYSRNTIYAISDGSLYRININQKTATQVIVGNINEYKIEKGRILFIEENSIEKFGHVSWVSTNRPKTIHREALWPYGEKGEFIKTNSHRISILNSKGELLIIDPTIKPNKIEENTVTIKNVKKAIWTRDGKRLVWTDGYGIYQRYFTNPITVIPTILEQRIITRYSEPISEMTLSENEWYVYFAIGGILRVNELTYSKTPRSIKLVESENTISNLKLDLKKQSISFLNEKGNLLILNLFIEQQRTFFFGN